MFSHPYRFWFILALSAYTYLNTVLCEVYRYFHIGIEWYYAAGTIFLVTLGAWESGRLLEPLFERLIQRRKNKIRTLGFFFLASTTLTTLITTGIVFLVSMVLHDHTVSETIVPLKLNLIYAWLASLLFHLLNAIKYYFTKYKSKWMEAEELKRISAQTELQLV